MVSSSLRNRIQYCIHIVYLACLSISFDSFTEELSSTYRNTFSRAIISSFTSSMRKVEVAGITLSRQFLMPKTSSHRSQRFAFWYLSGTSHPHFQRTALTNVEEAHKNLSRHQKPHSSPLLVFFVNFIHMRSQASVIFYSTFQLPPKALQE